MILPRYTIRQATYAQAGKGLFIEESVARGRVVCAPDQINTVYGAADKEKFTAEEDAASVRWFESYYTVSLDWPDECYINHSFSPTGLWHLGFVFAMDDLPAGTEITVDYRFIVDDGEHLPFKDEATGRDIVGLPWRENLVQSTRLLSDILT